MCGEIPLDGRGTLIFQARADYLGAGGVAEFVVRERQLGERDRRMRIGGQFIGGVGEVTLCEEGKAACGFVVVFNDKVACDRGIAFEFRDGVLRDFRLAVGGGPASFFAQNQREGEIAIGFAHSGDRFLDGGFHRPKLIEGGRVIFVELREGDGGFKLAVGFLQAASLFESSGQSFASLFRLTFPIGNHGFLNLSVQAIARARGGGDDLVVLRARTGVVAHQGARVGDAELGAVEVGRDFQRGGVVFDRA